MDLSNADASPPTTVALGSCPECGRPDQHGRFCGHCGARLGDGQTTEPTSAHIPEQVGLDDERPALLDEVLFGGVHDPTSVMTAPQEGEEPSPAGSRLAGRRGLVAGVAALLVVGLVSGGVYGAGYVADGDVRTALASSGRDFNSIIDRLGAATTAEQVAAAAGQADATAERVEDAQGRLKAEKDPVRIAVVDQLESEQAVLRAVAGLEGLARAPLATWGAAHSELTAALAAEDETRADLGTVDADAARGLSDTHRMLTKVTAAVGPALVEDATAESTRLLTTLTSAESTADLRELGDAAAPEQAAVAAAGKALPAGEGRQVLAGYAAGLSSLAELSSLSGDSAGSWTATRADLARTFGQVAAAAGSTGGAGVRVALDGALSSADGVVAAASAALTDWKAKTDAAIKARSTDAQALDDYTSFFRSQTKTYEQLRVDLSTFLERVDDPNANVTYYEAYDFLYDAGEQRRYVRDALVSTDVPSGIGTAHGDVAAAIDRAISAVQSAYDGFEQSEDCWDGCPYYRDAPGYRTFVSESEGVRTSYTAAISRWEAEVAAAKAAIANRTLPIKPEV